MLLTMHESPAHAWIAARDRRTAAQKDPRWSGDPELQRLGRYWNSVMREIERQSGYGHQPDTATRYLEINEREQRRRKKEEAAARRKRSS